MEDSCYIRGWGIIWLVSIGPPPISMNLIVLSPLTLYVLLIINKPNFSFSEIVLVTSLIKAKYVVVLDLKNQSIYGIYGTPTSK